MNTFVYRISELLFASKFRIEKGRIKIILLTVIGWYLLMVAYIFLLKFIDSFTVLPALNIHKAFEADSIIRIILLVLIVGPMIEELSFRAFLKYSAFNVAVSISLLVSHYFSFIGKFKLFRPDLTSIYFYLIPIIFVVLYLILRMKRISGPIEAFWLRYKIVIIILSVLLFATAHLKNLEWPVYDYHIVIPVLMLPHILMAITLSIIRIKFSLITSIVTHMLFNFIPVILMTLIKLKT